MAQVIMPAVSALNLVLPSVTNLKPLICASFNSFLEKSPSGPINMQKDFTFLRSSIFKLSLELTSANKIFEFSSKVNKKSLALTRSQQIEIINYKRK